MNHPSFHPSLINSKTEVRLTTWDPCDICRVDVKRKRCVESPCEVITGIPSWQRCHRNVLFCSFSTYGQLVWTCACPKMTDMRIWESQKRIKRVKKHSHASLQRDLIAPLCYQRFAGYSESDFEFLQQIMAFWSISGAVRMFGWLFVHNFSCRTSRTEAEVNAELPASSPVTVQCATCTKTGIISNSLQYTTWLLTHANMQ